MNRLAPTPAAAAAADADSHVRHVRATGQDGPGAPSTGLAASATAASSAAVDRASQPISLSEVEMNIWGVKEQGRRTAHAGRKWLAGLALGAGVALGLWAPGARAAEPADGAAEAGVRAGGASSGVAPQANPGIPGPDAPGRPAIALPEAAAAEAFLPILNYLGNDEVCDTWVTAQNVGANFTAVSLVLFGAPGFCAPQAAGPLKIECSGILKPGSSWNFLGAQIPAGAKSAQAFGFSTKMLSDVGLDTVVGFDDIIASYFCENAFFGIVGDADD